MITRAYIPFKVRCNQWGTKRSFLGSRKHRFHTGLDLQNSHNTRRPAMLRAVIYCKKEIDYNRKMKHASTSSSQTGNWM